PHTDRAVPRKICARARGENTMSEITTAYQAAYAEFEAAREALNSAIKRVSSLDWNSPQYGIELEKLNAADAAYKAARAAKTAAWHAVLIEASRGKYFRVVGVDDNAEMGFMLADATGEPEKATLFTALPDGATDEIGIVYMGRTSRTIYKVKYKEPPAPAPIRAIVVGRHAGEIPGVEVIEKHNIEWA